MNILNRKSTLWVIGSLIIWYGLTFLSHFARYLNAMSYELKLIKDGRATWYPSLMFFDQDYSILNLICESLFVIILSCLVYIMIKNKEHLLNIIFGLLYVVIIFKIVIYLKYDFTEQANDYLSVYHASVLLIIGIISLIISLHVNKLIGYYVSITSFILFTLLKMYEVISMITDNLNNQFRNQNVIYLYLFLLFLVMFLMTMFISILKYNKYAMMIASIVVFISFIVCWIFISKNYHYLTDANYYYHGIAFNMMIYDMISIIIYSALAMIGINKDDDLKIKHPLFISGLITVIILKFFMTLFNVNTILNYTLVRSSISLTIVCFNLIQSILMIGLFIWLLLSMIKIKYERDLILPIASCLIIIGVQIIQFLFIIINILNHHMSYIGSDFIYLLSFLSEISAPIFLILGLISFLQNRTYDAKRLMILSAIIYIIYSGLMAIYNYSRLHSFLDIIPFSTYIEMIFYIIYLSFYIYIIFRLIGNRLASNISIVLGLILIGIMLILIYNNVVVIIGAPSWGNSIYDVRELLISRVPTFIISMVPLFVIHILNNKAINPEIE